MSSIDDMINDGTLLMLFPSDSQEFIEILALRYHLSVEMLEKHPLHSENGQVTNTLSIGFTILRSSISIMDLLAKQNTQKLHQSVKVRMKDLQLLDNAPEIERAKSILQIAH
ncbi:hypothetical protein [Oligoflexus tunisiensis]|uniref:hypothetical protein n=1 Tax=Oligoflexus tunisiensis TaxID=708132 RepID=UPI001C406166|nr:hypothetical protein [Oligoflexus tunisiensis]